MVAAAIVSTLLLFLAASATGKPVEQRDTVASLVQLPFVKRVTVRQAQAEGINTPADNIAVSYIATVGVGSPPTNCKWFQHLVAD